MVWAFVVANIKPDQEVFPKSMTWRERGCRLGRPEADTGTERETWGPAELPVREIATSVSPFGRKKLRSLPHVTQKNKFLRANAAHSNGQIRKSIRRRHVSHWT